MVLQKKVGHLLSRGFKDSMILLMIEANIINVYIPGPSKGCQMVPKGC